MDKFAHCTLHAIQISKCAVVPAEADFPAQFYFPGFCITQEQDHLQAWMPAVRHDLQNPLSIPIYFNLLKLFEPFQFIHIYIYTHFQLIHNFYTYFNNCKLSTSFKYFNCIISLILFNYINCFIVFISFIPISTIFKQIQQFQSIV
jgi:hypothetical protein